ncbi:5'-methylthioadenosine/adenosylhomocysteine nucleosidase, partial [Francisella tularensis subsp. holarctica]|nr:5'-methylthioadenosine/adenosylhomocysteine nucleosidase [Francisella tularensis subsp. holarctica]
RKDFVIKDFDAKAIEMEGASVKLICNEMGVPSLILRSISDTADGDAPENFDEFAKIAAKRSANFIMQILINI